VTVGSRCEAGIEAVTNSVTIDPTFQSPGIVPSGKSIKCT